RGVRHGRRARPALRPRGGPQPGRRRPVDPEDVRHGCARGRRGKELPVTHHPDQKGFTAWFTGLSGAGKSTLAEALFHELRRRDLRVELLDGDVVRPNPTTGLGVSTDERQTPVPRLE